MNNSHQPANASRSDDLALEDDVLMTPEVDIEAADTVIEHRVQDIENGVEELARDVSGAEFLAATELAEDIGIEMEFQARLQRISSTQWQYVMEDYQKTFDELQSARTPIGFFTVGLEHLNRRALHQQEGWLSFLQSWYIEQKKLAEAHQQLTQPLLDLLAGKQSAR